ncbi:MAG: hypothetical protein QMD71_04355 [bacterium]|nr:hypothetical protein [bacterium]
MKKLLPILILIIVGCEKPPFETYPGALNVFALIRSDRPRQWVKVEKTYKMDESATGGVSDALVVIKSESSVDTLFLSDSTPFTYVSRDSIPIIPMHTYYISVKTEDLDSIYGTTTAPDTVVILHPEDGDTVSLSDSLVFKNKNVYNQDMYNQYDVVAYTEDTMISSVISGMGYFEVDTIVVIRFSALVKSAGFYRIKIMTYDKNYTQYIRGNEIGETSSSAGIKGGFGVFGSAIVKGLYIYIKPE